MSRPTVLVTGSGRRLGRHILLAFHRKRQYDLVLHYNSSVEESLKTEKEITSEGGNVLRVQADLSKPDEIEGLFSQIESRYGRLDILVNNAAIFNKYRWDEIDADVWDNLHQINIRAVFLCSRAGARLMLKNPGSGKIINFASLGGIQAWKDHIHYGAAKAGVIHLTKTLARSLAPHITVNAIAPGTIIIENEEDPEIKHINPDRILLKRYGEPADITDIVMFLSTSASYITGVTIPVDGGQSIGYTGN
jgi:NAD(P)-dependent dehydrogenase (short-subunit alcohol dehydrogenase family)